MKSVLALLICLLPGAAFAAASESVALPAGDCRKLVQHVPRADVEYKAGVDVHGKAVVPADAGGGYQLALPESVDIQVGVDLADRLGMQTANRTGQPAVRNVGPATGFAPLGTLSIKGNEAYWNGNRIQPQDEALLADACRKGLSTLPTEKPEIPK